MTNGKIRVAVVDDSALMRQLLTSMISADPELEVVGSAQDPYVARELIKKTNPDVLTLDIEMPKMDGLTFLHKIMTLRPMPVLMVSSLTQEGADATIQALELGAVDFVGKPAADIQAGLAEKQTEIIGKIKAAARAKVRPMKKGGAQTAPTVNPGISFKSTEKIILIGASTGGVEALAEVLAPLPPDSPAILVTQHMPPKFTTTFAERLNTFCKVSVAEARDGQRIMPGHVLIAPGDYHLELNKSGANYTVKLTGGPPVSGHRPSVDVLFRSGAKIAGANAIGVILTGMGRDGAAGLREMRDRGARTIGQDEASSVVYGMPRMAYEMGGVQKQMTLSKIPLAMLRACGDEQVRAVRV